MHMWRAPKGAPHVHDQPQVHDHRGLWAVEHPSRDEGWHDQRVKPAPFTYHRPTTLAEALDTLAEVGGDGKVLAGGQSLVPLLSMRLASPGHLVDINRLTALSAIEARPDGVRLGAIVRHAAVEKHAGAVASQPLLGQALAHVAHPTIRNRGTSVGSLVHADPAGELTAVLAVTGGTVTLASRAADGSAATRVVPASEFFVGPLESATLHGELAVEAFFPSLDSLAAQPDTRMGSAFVEVARRHGDYAVCGVAAVVGLVPGSDTEGTEVCFAKVAYISMGPVPIVVDVSQARPEETCDPTTAAAWTQAGDFAVSHTEPEADIHATAAYRLMLGRVLAARALAAATREARHRAAQAA
jgi:carbon-monoxide dehydrogenase medium subunit